MTEEPTGGTGQPTPDVAPAAPAAQPAPEPAPDSTQEVTPPKYSGKSLEELAQELAEKDRYISEVNERAARAEHEALLTRNLVEQFAREKGQPQAQAPQDEFSISDDDFLTKPGETFKKGFQWMEARLRAEREREKAEQYVSTARQSYEQGIADAVKTNPALYRGIEGDLKREVLNTVQSALKAGQPIDSSVLRNPKYWEAAALAMRVMQGEDASRYYQRHPSPMSPGHTETPGPSGVPKVGMTLTPEEEELIARGNITREQYLAAKEKERGIAEGRKR